MILWDGSPEWSPRPSRVCYGHPMTSTEHTDRPAPADRFAEILGVISTGPDNVYGPGYIVALVRFPDEDFNRQVGIYRNQIVMRDGKEFLPFGYIS